jgi:anti-sigma factor RsiW
VLNKLKALISDQLQAFSSGSCRNHEARLEDYLQGNLQGNDEADLNNHLAKCGNCRAALEKARLGGQLLRDAWQPASEARSTFVAGVMAKIREEEARAASPAAFWNPLEFLASRLSLTAATILLALSVYMVGFAPRRSPALPTSARTELNTADFPQPPGDPESNEDVLQSLVERNYGR